MNTDDRKGRAVTAEELFDHCLTLADIGMQSQGDAHALRDEVKRVLNAVTASHNEALQQVIALSNQVGKQGDKLQSMYAPELVKGAASNAQKAVNEFEAKTGGVFDSIQSKADGVIQSFWIRTLGAVAVGAAMLVIVFFLLWWFVPGLDELKARRAEWQQLSEALNIKSLNYNGGKWVQVVGEVQKLCEQDKPTNCANYLRLR